MRGEERNFVQGQQEKSQHCNEPISVENTPSCWWILFNCGLFGGIFFFFSLSSPRASLPQTALLGLFKWEWFERLILPSSETKRHFRLQGWTGRDEGDGMPSAHCRKI